MEKSEMDKVDEKMKNLSIDDKKKLITEPFSVKTPISEQEKKFFLPKLSEYIKKMNVDVLDEMLFFNKEKFESFISRPEGYNAEAIIEKDAKPSTLDLTKEEIKSLVDSPDMLTAIVTFLGGDNRENDITDLTDFNEWKKGKEPGAKMYFQNCLNFTEYITRNLELMFHSFNLKNFNTFIKLLNALGFTIEKKLKNGNPNNFFYLMLNYVYAKNKINIILAGGNNLWIKSEEASINNVGYDLRQNHKDNIFINDDFWTELKKKIIEHPRCNFCIISSKMKKSLIKIMKMLEILVNTDEKYPLFDQIYHNIISKDEKGKPTFVRNVKKIKEVNPQIQDENSLYLESELDKLDKANQENDYSANMIPLRLFEKTSITEDPVKKDLLNEQIKKIIDYILELFENCDGDIRDYLKDHPFK